MKLDLTSVTLVGLYTVSMGTALAQEMDTETGAAPGAEAEAGDTATGDTAVDPVESGSEEIKATEATPPTTEATVDADKVEISEVGTEQLPPADESLGISVSARLGAMVPFSGLGLTYFLGLDANYRLPFFDRLFAAGIELSISQPGQAGTINSSNAGSFEYDLSTRMITLGFEALASKSFGDLTPYGALGYGLYFLHSNAEAFGDENTEDQVRAGFQIRGGCGYPLGPGEVIAELRFHYVNLRFLATGKSNAGGMTLNVGYRYGF
ncbi:hypothetical protein ACFL6C_06655 [Myxococcota bacterium]